jgi:hypothetical protein
MDRNDMDNQGPGFSTFIKTARLHARMAYAPIADWEFKDLATEADVQERLGQSTVYIIAKRPVIFFDKVDTSISPMTFEIADDSGHRVSCQLDVFHVLGLTSQSHVEIEVCYMRDVRRKKLPHLRVDALKVFVDGEFSVWWSPAKLLFEVRTRDLPLRLIGDINPFHIYDVCYIGQAHQQRLWKRLAVHGSLKNIVSEELVRASRGKRRAPEISVFPLEILGIEETAHFVGGAIALPEECEPIFHRVEPNPESESFTKFFSSWMEPTDAAATNELETMLIWMFRPPHNKLQYKSYPNVKRGGRSAGYTYTDVFIENIPYLLRDPDGNEPLDNDPEVVGS